ncbi:MAG: ferritin-like fold-containing protein [Actinomycetota bacterium]
MKSFRKKVGKLALPDREERASRTQGKVNLKPYTPEPKVFLGQLAYLLLSNFEILTNALKLSPTTGYKASLSEAATKSFDRYRAISKKLSALGYDVTDSMDPYTERIDTFHSRTTGIDWYETIIKIYLVSGLLDDFYTRLAIGLNAELRADVEKALSDKTFEKFAVRVLKEGMEGNPQLESRLALWGRRIMGDVLLEVRAAFDNRKLAGTEKGSKLSQQDEREINLASYSKIEPLVTEMIAAHSLRMDAIGLTA